VRLLHYYSNTFTGSGGPQELIERTIREERHAVATVGAVASARQLRKHEINLLTARFLKVRNMRQVAREWRISPTTVAKYLADRGMNTSRGMSEADIAGAVRLYAKGWSSIRIGQQLGFDNHTVLGALRSEGVPIRHAACAR